MSNIPWVIKYRPKRIAEVENQDDAKRKFVAWLQSWLKGRPTKKAALLYGPPGSGKTSLVEAAAKEYNLELIEMNASDFRRRKDIERVAKIAASQMSLFSKKGKIILLDEVDGISGRADAGGLEAILELIKLTRHPIVMTANDPWDPRLRSLREESVLIEFKRLPKTTIINVLKKICLAEGLKCDYNALSYLAEKSEGDLRSAINDLEAIGRAYNHVTLALVKAMVRPRDREHTPFEALRNLFTSRYVWQAKMAIMQTNVDYETMMQWINENIPYQLTDSEDLWRAYESLSRADQYFGRIKKSGSWDLLAYVFDLMGPGVALARKKTRYKWVRYSFPQKILLMSKTKQVREIRDALARHIASRILTSSAIVKSDVLPYLKVIFENNPLYAARLAIGLELTESMIKYLAGPKASEVISYVRRLKSGKIPPSMIKRIK